MRPDYQALELQLQIANQRIAERERNARATEQALHDERARAARMEPMWAAGHNWAAAYLDSEVDLVEVRGAQADILAAHDATTPSPDQRYVVVSVEELQILKAQADRYPEGEYACTVCGGRGEVQHGGYYVPGEQFCEPPGEEPCAACVGSGQREVQALCTIKNAALELAEVDCPNWFGPAIDKLRVALGTDA